MENNERVLYYCHSVKNDKEINSGNILDKDKEDLYQIKILDEYDKDIMLNYLGIPSENNLLKFFRSRFAGGISLQRNFTFSYFINRLNSAMVFIGWSSATLYISPMASSLCNINEHAPHRSSTWRK